MRVGRVGQDKTGQEGGKIYTKNRIYKLVCSRSRRFKLTGGRNDEELLADMRARRKGTGPGRNGDESAQNSVRFATPQKIRETGIEEQRTVLQ